MSRTNGLFSRRHFLKTAGAASVGSLLTTAGAAVPAAAKTQTGETQVPTRPFGKTGVEVSCLGLGGMFDIPSNQIMLRQAFKWGVTYWDTADCYGGGRSERGIGMFLGKYQASRGKVFLVTKSDARDPRGMTRLLNRSLERMNTSYIDLYLIHGVSSIREINAKMRTWAEKAKAANKIRFFGFSTHSNMENCMLDAARLGWVDGIMMTYNFRLMHTDRMKAAVAACIEAGIGLTAMKTQGGGSVRTHSETELRLAGRFLQKGFTDKQARLKAVWENPKIASICSQMPNLTILMSNVATALDRTSLAAGDMRLLQQYARETASGYCAGCTHICEASLANTVPVGDVMRYLMYYHDYGERDRARALFAQIPSDIRDLLDHVNYRVAEERCPQGLPIGRLIREARKTLA